MTQQLSRIESEIVLLLARVDRATVYGIAVALGQGEKAVGIAISRLTAKGIVCAC